MAITKTREIERIDIQFEGAADLDAVLHLVYVDVWDDPDDADLPVRKVSHETLTKYLPPDPLNMEEEQTLTDISGYSQVIQDICAVVWPE